MTLASHPVWPFEPNWESSVGETLSWMTDVMMSPTGAEQRRSLRYLPQRTFKFAVAVEGEERSLFDNMLMAHAADDWYLPIWHDVTISTAQSTFVGIQCEPSAALKVGTPVFIKGETVYDFQITEITEITDTGIKVSPALTRVVPAGTIIHPMTVGRLIEQPALTAMTDAVEVADTQFLVTEPAIDTGVTVPVGLLSDEYRDFHVLTLEPDWADNMERGQQRLYDTFEPVVGTPLRNDTANRPFPTQRHKWVLDGVDDHGMFYALLQALRGRAVPVWVPTWMHDMHFVTAVTGNDTITVARCGFTLSGGPRPEREDIMIETVNGERIYARIANSASDSSGNEVLLLDTVLPSNLQPSDVLRICFMSLMRLDQDSIDIEHLTDMEGVSEVQVTFRAAPNLRVAEPAF